MSRRPSLSYTIVAALSLALLSADHATADESRTAIASPPIVDRKHTIVIGRVSDNPSKHMPRVEAMAGYLAERLAPLGITAGAAVIAADNDQMVEFLRNGTVDVVSETILSALKFTEEAGAEILLREWKRGAPTYRTVFFTRRDSDITSLSDLRGRTLAFEDPGSTSAFLVPLAMLRQEGLRAAEIRTPRSKAAEDMVGYGFAGGEANIAAWVHRGMADAGAFNNQDWAERTPHAMKPDLRVFHEGEPVIRSLLLVRRGLAPEMKAALSDVLTTMHENPEAAEVLTRAKVSRYDQITDTERQHLDRAMELYALVHEEVG